MSKDWKPYEQYLADNAMKEMRGEALRDMKITFTYNGETVPFGNPEAKKRYPELSFLYGEFNGLYEQYKNNAEVLTVFNAFENALKEVEEQFKTDIGFGNGTTDSCVRCEQLWKLPDEEFLKLPIKTVVQEWFFGRLSPTFFYNESNNETFCRFIKAKVNEK